MAVSACHSSKHVCRHYWLFLGISVFYLFVKACVLAVYMSSNHSAKRMWFCVSQQANLLSHRTGWRGEWFVLHCAQFVQQTHSVAVQIDSFKKASYFRTATPNQFVPWPTLNKSKSAPVQVVWTTLQHGCLAVRVRCSSTLVASPRACELDAVLIYPC